jgi:DeoR family transcriptional regulator of aga operon/DeoR family myo-inositol catabolism operon transcriptional repressor
MKKTNYKMPQERLISLKEYINKKKISSMKELLSTYDVSYLTLSRDLKKLEKEGFIYKVHGGVILKEYSDTEEPIFLKQQEAHLDEKDRIAHEASKRINNGDIILLESGSTILKIIKYIKNKKDLTVITAGVPQIIELWKLAQKKDDLTVYLTGGLLLPKVSSFAGRHSMNFFKTINIDKAFIGAHAISLEQGLSGAISYDAEIISAVKSSSRELFLLSDSSKFGKYSIFNVLPLEEISEIITDTNLEKNIAEGIRNKNIKLTLV